MVLAAAAAACFTNTYLVEPNCQNPPKNQLKNSWNWQFIFMPTTIWQVSEFDVQPITRNGNDYTSAETWVEENSWNRNKWPALFCGGFFPIWNHCATRARAWTRCATMTWSVRNISRFSTLHPGYKWLRTRTTAHWTEPFDGIISLADLDYLDWVALTQISCLFPFWLIGSNPKI